MGQKSQIGKAPEPAMQLKIIVMSTIILIAFGLAMDSFAVAINSAKCCRKLFFLIA